jgi:hypothetical protein
MLQAVAAKIMASRAWQTTLFSISHSSIFQKPRTLF